MRSLCTISLVVLIGLASYGNVHAQNPAGTWCLPLTQVKDPSTGTYNSASTGIQTGTVSGQPPAFTGPVDTLGNQANVPCSSAEPSGQCLIDPRDVILAINAARAKEMYPQTNGVYNPSGTLAPLPPLVLPGQPNSGTSFPDYYQNLTQMRNWLF